MHVGLYRRFITTGPTVAQLFLTTENESEKQKIGALHPFITMPTSLFTLGGVNYIAHTSNTIVIFQFSKVPLLHLINKSIGKGNSFLIILKKVILWTSLVTFGYNMIIYIFIYFSLLSTLHGTLSSRTAISFSKRI